MQNIYLIGPMGVGKSTIGRALAKHLGMDFVDSDSEIEERTGATISLIFDIEGEDGFRKRETQMIGELVDRRNMVLATGGGSIMTEENKLALRKNGVVVYLYASIDTLVARVRNPRNRPLLEGADDPEAVLRELFATRDPVYREEADHVFDTDDRSPAAVAREISRVFEK